MIPDRKKFMDECRAKNGGRTASWMYEAYRRAVKDALEPGDGMTLYLYSDSHAYTVIKKTAKSITLRRDKAILDPAFKPDFIPGGFCGTVTNQHEQRYTYEPDPGGDVIRAFWSERYMCYRWNGLSIGPGRHEFYDYNF